MEAYDQTYQIFDHDANGDTDQMAVIGMHPAEDFITGSRLELISREILGCRLPELTNTSLLELMQYPRWFLDRLIKDGRKSRSTEEDITRQMEQNLENQQRGGA